MKFWLWNLLGRSYWIRLNSHFRDSKGARWYAEWEQKRDKVQDVCHYVERLRSIPRILPLGVNSGEGQGESAKRKELGKGMHEEVKPLIHTFKQ